MLLNFVDLSAILFLRMWFQYGVTIVLNCDMQIDVVMETLQMVLFKILTNIGRYFVNLFSCAYVD